MAPKSSGKFPRFTDGDVEIHLSVHPNDVFVLHSVILKHHSEFFEKSLSDVWTQDGRKECSSPHWVYNLRFEKDEPDGILIREKNNKAEDNTTSFLFNPDRARTSGLEVKSAREACIQAHHKLLSFMYHKSPLFRTRSAEALEDISALVDMSDMYGCISMIEVHINNYVMSHKKLLDHIAMDPIAFLGMSYKMRSAWMFKEAATHIVCAERHLRNDVEPPSLKQWIQKKRAAFEAELRNVDFKLLCLRDEDYNQVAYSYFKDWFAQRLEEGEGSGRGKNYARVYRDITERGRCEPWGELKNFLECARVIFEGPDDDLRGQLESVFSEASVGVSHLLKTNIITAVPKRLAFVTIDDDELPWNNGRASP